VNIQYTRLTSDDVIAFRRYCANWNSKVLKVYSPTYILIIFIRRKKTGSEEKKTKNNLTKYIN